MIDFARGWHSRSRLFYPSQTCTYSQIARYCESVEQRSVVLTNSSTEHTDFDDAVQRYANVRIVSNGGMETCE